MSRLLARRWAVRSALALLALVGMGALAERSPPRAPLSLDDLTAVRDVAEPHLSPDGHWVAFSVTQDDIAEDRRVARVDGTNRRRLAHTHDDLATLQWIPSGRDVTFISNRGAPGNHAQLWQVSFASGKTEALTHVAGDVTRYAWSRADYIVARGIADAERLGIGGWSYGGMLTNHTIARDGRFRAAVSGALCAVAFLLLLWAIYWLRLRHLTRTFNITFEARVNERTRIARELHDTLLQSLHGLMFQFQAVRNLLPRRPDDAMQSLDQAIDDTERALAESRDAIRDLRSEPLARGDLAALLMAASRELAKSGTADQQPPVFELIKEGEKRALSSTAKNEVCRIALEILRNAYRHAHASRIEAEIRYDDRILRVRIRDNGRGFDSRLLKEGGIAGHWGLRGVRERAERLGARLDFWSEAGAGTEVQLTVPPEVAYQTAGDDVGSRLLRKVRSHAEHS